MSIEFDSLVTQFIALAQIHKLKMILVGGAAVNFYGYNRHSADFDFWISIIESYRAGKDM